MTNADNAASIRDDLELRKQDTVNKAAILISGWVRQIYPPDHQGPISSHLAELYMITRPKGAIQIDAKKVVDEFVDHPSSFLSEARAAGLTEQEGFIGGLDQLQSLFSSLVPPRFATEAPIKNMYEDAAITLKGALAVLRKPNATS
ncbi:MAG TPA: hypothetical protein VMR81_03500 [Patescibacteria group bacterium]|nr:hypothetical protein [Patescibacteria group bacterium]